MIKSKIMTDDIAKKVKVIFYDVVSRSGGKDWFCKAMPEWCEAVDSLPDVAKINSLNTIEREIMQDIIEECIG